MSVVASGEQPVAKPILSVSWRARSVDAGAVNKQLSQLWAELNGPKPLRVTRSAFQTGSLAAHKQDGQASQAHVLARANTVNLIAVARNGAQARRIENAVFRLTHHYPSRAVILISDPAQEVHQRRLPSEPDAPTPEPLSGLDIRISLMEQDAGSNRSPVRFECVTVEGSPSSMGNPVSLATPLLVPELPVFAWWPGDLVVDQGLFRDIADLADRVIVDTSRLGDATRGLPLLARLLDQPRPETFLSDMAWRRLTDWRNLIAQFFDGADTRRSLEWISEVTIGYAMEPIGGGQGGGLPGLTAGLLLTGWLATRLGWRPLQQPDRTHLGLRVVFQGPHRNHPVIVRLKPEHVAADPVGLGSVVIDAIGDAPGEFKVERTESNELMTTSETPNMPRVSRIVHGLPTDDAHLLEAELQQFGRDRIFEESLAFASDLFARR